MNIQWKVKLSVKGRYVGGIVIDSGCVHMEQVGVHCVGMR